MARQEYMCQKMKGEKALSGQRKEEECSTYGGDSLFRVLLEVGYLINTME